ncbi:MAG: MMPL family transporter [Candidatus Thermoplasmatota archaeon]|nr:MMPL family transporter [Candidatus Thermoplasmatota archaeon]
MFNKLADFIIKHYKFVIVVWLVLLFYAFPLIFKINDVVMYTETEVGLNKLEAIQAQNLIDEKFPGQIANSTITIVIQNSDVTSPQAREFSTNLYNDIRQDGAIQGVISVDYVYSVLESYIAGVVAQSGPGMYDLHDQVGQIVQIVYKVPLDIVDSHLQLTAVGYTDDEARNLTIQGLTAQLLSNGMDATMIDFVIGYANQTFYAAWLVTHTNVSAELQTTIVAAADSYFSSIPGQTSEFAIMVAHSFSVQFYRLMTTQQQEAMLEGFVINLTSAQIEANATFVSEIWNLGPHPSAAGITALAHGAVFNYTIDQIPIRIPKVFISRFINTDPISGTANTTMLMAVSLSVAGSSHEAQNDVRDIRDLVKQELNVIGSGYEVFVSGDAALEVDTMDAVAQDTSRVDPVTVILVVLLVGLFFRSLISPWIPLITIGMAYLVTTAVIYILGTYVMAIHYSVTMLILVVMLGAGTDYCIFIMSRYREERVAGRSKEESVKTSLMWAGESIATSGATVMIGFGSLMISEYSMIRSMGMALVVAIGITLLFALTMLPSLLMFFGDRVFWPNTMAKATERAKALDERGGGYFRKSVEFSLKHSKAIVLAALVISVPAVYFYFALEPSYDFMASLPNAESKRGIDALGSGFGEGTIMPTYIVIQFDQSIRDSNGSLDLTAGSQLEQYSSLVGGHSNIRTVSGPTRPFGEPVNNTYLQSLPPVELATYEMAIANTIGRDNRTVMLTVVLQDEPFTTNSIHSIDDIRSLNSQAKTDIFHDSATVLVGGSTASMLDVSGTVSHDFLTMRIVVLVGIYIVLMLVLGSLLIPFRLIMTVLLNVTWTIAMTMLIFQYGYGSPVLWMMPLILFVVAMGLGMDYDIFLTTRIREEVLKGKSDAKAITTAVERTGGIITACGLVMAGAFGSMMLSTTVLLREFGFGLAFAILLDAMILRIYLVPAIMLLLEKWNWYAPGRLQRVRREEKSRNH